MDADTPRERPRYIRSKCTKCETPLVLGDRDMWAQLVHAAWPHDEPRLHFDETIESLSAHIRYLADVEERLARIVHRSPLERPVVDLLAELREVVRDLAVPPK